MDKVFIVIFLVAVTLFLGWLEHLEFWDELFKFTDDDRPFVRFLMKTIAIIFVLIFGPILLLIGMIKYCINNFKENHRND